MKGAVIVVMVNMQEMDEIILSNMYKYKRLNEQRIEEVLKRYKLRKIDVEILIFLNNEKNSDTAKDIARTGMFTKGHISQSIKHMKELGLVEVKQDKNDLRVQHIKLKKSAKKVLDDMTVIKADIEKSVFAGVSDEERQIMQNIMKKIYVNISEIIKEN